MDRETDLFDFNSLPIEDIQAMILTSENIRYLKVLLNKDADALVDAQVDSTNLQELFRNVVFIQGRRQALLELIALSKDAEAYLKFKPKQ